MPTRSGRISFLVVSGLFALVFVSMLLWPAVVPLGAQEKSWVVEGGINSTPSLLLPANGATLVLGASISDAEGVVLPFGCRKPTATLADLVSMLDVSTENTPALGLDWDLEGAQEEDYIASLDQGYPNYSFVLEVGETAFPAVDLGPYLVSLVGFTGEGQATLHATAYRQDESGGPEIVGMSQFNVISSGVDADTDLNALPDNPFTSLPVDKSFWFAQTEGETGVIACAAARWGYDPADQSGPVILLLRNPDLPDALAVVEVPRELAQEGETAILIAAAAEKLPTLLGSAIAGEIPDPPSGTLVAGGMYIDLSILITSDGGMTFDEIDAARLNSEPIWLTMYGIAPPNDEQISIVSFPTFIDSVPETGLRITAGDGAWRQDHTSNVVTQETSVTTSVVDLAICAPYVGMAGQDEVDETSTADGTNVPVDTGVPSTLDDTLSSLPLSEGEDPFILGGETMSLTSSEIWVNFLYPGPVETGTMEEPFKTLGGGLGAVDPAGAIKLVGGAEPVWSGETPRITQAVRLEVVGGTVRIGGGAHIGWTAQELQRIFYDADTSGDGVLDIAECQAVFPALTQQDFDCFDANGDGFLTPQELVPDTDMRTLYLTFNHGQIAQNPEPTLQTTFTSPDGGTKGYAYVDGSLVTLTATPDSGYFFAGWEGDPVTENPSNPLQATVTMDGDQAVRAVFASRQIALGIYGGGEVTLDPPDVAVSEPYSLQEYTSPGTTEVTLTGAAIEGLVLSHWLLDGQEVPGPGPLTVTLGENEPAHAVDAVFLPDIGASFNLGVGEGGTVHVAHSAPYDVDDQDVTEELSEALPEGTQVILTHTTDVGKRLAFWTIHTKTGTTVSTDAALNLTIDDFGVSVFAAFEDDIANTGYSLTMTSSGLGYVYPGEGVTWYGIGETVNLSVSPAPGWVFTGWYGTAITVDPQDPLAATLVMNANATVHASFEPDGPWGGDLDVPWYPVFIETEEGGYAEYEFGYFPAGATVSVACTAYDGWQFARWASTAATVADPLSAATVVIVNGPVFLRAYYTPVFQIIRNYFQTEHGTITVEPDLPGGYPYGTEVTFTYDATDPAYEFGGWVSDLKYMAAVAGSGGDAFSKTVAADRKIFAHAKERPKTFTLTFQKLGEGEVHISPSGPYEAGEAVRIVAIPDLGYSFGGWSGDIQDFAVTPITGVTDFTMGAADRSIAVTFEADNPATYSVYYLPFDPTDTVSRVESEPADSTLGLEEGTSVTLTPVSEGSDVFVRWEGDITSMDEVHTIESIDRNIAATAIFAPEEDAELALLVRFSEDDIGEMTENAVKFESENGETIEPYEYAPVVYPELQPVSVAWFKGQATWRVRWSAHQKLTATIDSENFSSWHSGDLLITSPSERTYRPIPGAVTGFSTQANVGLDLLPPYPYARQLHVGYSYRVISVTGEGIPSYGGNTPFYPDDTIYSIFVPSDPLWGSPDVGWLYDVLGSPLYYDENSNTTYEDLVFVQAPPDYTIQLSVSGSGTVSASGDYWDEQAHTAGYSEGQRATVTATPEEGWRFVSWMPPGENPVCHQESYAFTVTQNRTLIATFKQVDKTLTTSVQGEGRIVADNRKDKYPHGTEIRLDAVADISHHFVRWEGDCSGSQTANPMSITMDGDKEVIALFEADEDAELDFTLYLDMDDDGVVEEYDPSIGMYEYMQEDDGQPYNGPNSTVWKNCDEFQKFKFVFDSKIPPGAEFQIVQRVFRLVDKDSFPFTWEEFTPASEPINFYQSAIESVRWVEDRVVAVAPFVHRFERPVKVSLQPPEFILSSPVALSSILKNGLTTEFFAVIPNSALQGEAKVELTFRIEYSGTVKERSIPVWVASSIGDNGYYNAALDFMAESGAKVFLDSQSVLGEGAPDTYWVAVLPHEGTRFQPIDAKYGPRLNYWEPEYKAEPVQNISEVIRNESYRDATLIVNGVYFKGLGIAKTLYGLMFIEQSMSPLSSDGYVSPDLPYIRQSQTGSMNMGIGRPNVFDHETGQVLSWTNSAPDIPLYDGSSPNNWRYSAVDAEDYMALYGLAPESDMRLDDSDGFLCLAEVQNHYAQSPTRKVIVVAVQATGIGSQDQTLVDAFKTSAAKQVEEPHAPIAFITVLDGGGSIALAAKTVGEPLRSIFATGRHSIPSLYPSRVNNYLMFTVDE